MAETADIDWTPEGIPRSRRFDDIYFSREGGLEETRAVFLEGCGLPEAWRTRRRFTVAELGFGTGLNLLALLQLWRTARPPGGRLAIFSVEAYPLAREAAARALAAWPEVADLASPLLDAWPQAPGAHRIDFPGLGASLDLVIGEAAEALRGWSGKADAWFLDGFAPARNPQMWREEVLALAAARSAPGARLATFTVAGAVRRGLAAQGFVVDKRPGFGAKGERLEARWPGQASEPAAPGRVCVVGAGIAGAALARALSAHGMEVVVVDRSGPAAGASGNPAALVTPRFDAGGGPVARLHAQAVRRAVDLIRREAPEAILAEGALQLEAIARDQRRFDLLATSELFEAGALARLSAADVADRLGEPVPAGGLFIREGLVVEPQVLIGRWLQGVEPMRADIARLERADGRWRALDAGGARLLEADAVCVAAGWAASGLLPGLALQPVRGQASLAAWPDKVPAAAFGGYVVPTRAGLLFGATHDRGDTDSEVRLEDHARNLALLERRRPRLAAALADLALEGRAGVRASTPDRSPLAGAAPGLDGVFMLTGLGGRGFTLAPLLAEHLAAGLCGAPSPLPADLAAAVAPSRPTALCRTASGPD